MSKQAWHFGTPERDPAELAEESARRRAEAALEERARRPLSYNPINNPLTPGPRTPAEAPVDKLPAMLERALANPRRLRTPARQRTAFLEQLARCGSVLEAALRAGVNRGTVYRWRAKDPDFAGRWADAIRRRAEEVGDDIALQANQVEVQPVFYRGQKIGERRRVNTQLLIHVQNRLDADRRRAEDRAERRELILLRAELVQRSREIRQSATPAATPSMPEMCSDDLGLPAAA
ncbi:MAG: hypothetical protein A3D94_01525 [Alphaproteobacteria bacterium RIFCSPHIGHO2_12_FULL_66_14]|jgi:hypothetical protein|nr:MAG: hypothetical protein A3D94_01525 [Alphaproteobacteria bacterium RIFCSPHIGHO2_12_FULL_66_14]